ncbi:MAG: DNRLRE domain-containing protein [Lachnospiraceae bacterium]|nr:DNRLRE domain-containing protein [Lachnospiraceae bacterium]
MKRIIKKAIAIVLTIAITGTSNGIGSLGEVRAESTNQKSNEQEEIVDAGFREPEIVSELVDERTVNSNTYLMSDGSKKTEFFFSNIRYEENGTLKDYDNEVVNISNSDKQVLNSIHAKNVNNYKYVNKSSDSKVYFSENIEDGLILKHGKYSLTMSPVIDTALSNDDTEEYETNIEETTTNNEEISEQYEIIKDTNNKDEVKYQSESEEIEYQYIVKENGVKENIVINSKPDTSVFEFDINTKNVYLKKDNGDRNIVVCDNDTDDTVGIIQVPFLLDADGNEDYQSVEYELDDNDDKTTLKVVVDEEYFENENLAYPVIIDPPMMWQFWYLSTATVWQASFMADTNMHSENLIALNNMMTSSPYNTEERVYLDTHNLLTGNSLVGNGLSFSDKYIEWANIRLFENSYPYYYTVGTLQLRNAAGSWDPNTITWNNQPGVSSDVIVSEQMTGVEGEEHFLDITDWAQAVADGSQVNNGLVFTCEQGGSACFYGPEPHYISDGNGGYSGIRHMSLTVYYRDLEPYDATVDLSAAYDEQTDKFLISIDDQNELESGVEVSGYKIFTRKDNENKFHSVTVGDDITEEAEVDAGNVNECVDLRACILYSNGTVRVSNIVTLEKEENEQPEETTSELESVIEETTTEGETLIDRGYTFVNVIKDTDGDELEDGYEIWDFKTYWNEETLDSTPEEPVYELDTDGDGFPDSYEVFTLGTDPAIANTVDEDSDGDNWTDLREYQEGTDPWLADSDFDGTNDSGDSTPRKTNDYTRQTAAAQATVHVGLYDKQYSETIDGVTYTYITDIYKGTIKKIDADYGSVYLNKTIKYFYDGKGNNTAIVEAYDDAYDPNHTQTICITYTYDSDNNLTFICDQRTKYTMTYNNDGDMTNLKVGNQSLMTYVDTELVNNAGNDGDISNIQIGGIIEQNEHSDTYGNNQVVRTVTTTYKVAENDTTSTASTTELYYNSDTSPTYISYFNSEGELKKFEDYTEDAVNPIEWNYTYSENGSSLTRSDNFTKSVQTTEDEDTGVVSTSTSYGFKNLKNISTTYTSTISSETETETNASGDDITVEITDKTLHNNDTVRIETSEDTASEIVHSSIFNTDLINNTYEKIDITHASYNVDLSGSANDKSFDYTYDLAGNITQIKENNVVKSEYGYDAHGRLNLEKDYVTFNEYDYVYNTNGNVYAKTEYPINANGVRTSNNGTTVYYTYENSNWPDQLTTYAGQTITYDNNGNPLNYINGMSFTWEHGRQLSQITMSDNSTVSYLYNEKGLRTFKETSDYSTVYEWDDDNLIREIVTDKSTNKKTDIWYLYDGVGDLIGFEYNYFLTDIVLANVRLYYEKNLQGDVIGILNAHGDRVVSYTYDAWGNVTSASCATGSDMTLALNHIKYRGYYQDDETGFYYLQSRYYDSETGRFISTDNIKYINIAGTIFGNNIYCYCEQNPVLNTDPSGNKSSKFIGFGVQVSIAYGNLGVGFEAVWYTGGQVNTRGQSRNIPFCYAYGETSANTSTISNCATDIYNLLKKNPTQFLSKPSLNCSICFFGVLGYTNFREPKDYAGRFASSGVAFGGYKGYKAWSGYCYVYGAGKYWGSSSHLSINQSYYILLNGKEGVLTKLYNQVKSKV